MSSFRAMNIDDHEISLRYRVQFWIEETRLYRKIQETYWKLIPYDWRVGQIWYRFKCWAWHRYTTVKPRTLDHTWYDRSGLLPHCMFEILGNFLENELNWPDGEDFKHDISEAQVDGRRQAIAELGEIYQWWKDLVAFDDAHYQKWHDFIEAHRVPDEDGETLFSPKYDTPENEAEAGRLFKEAMQAEKADEYRLTQNLIRLVKLREYMWT